MCRDLYRGRNMWLLWETRHSSVASSQLNKTYLIIYGMRVLAQTIYAGVDKIMIEPKVENFVME